MSKAGRSPSSHTLDLGEVIDRHRISELLLEYCYRCEIGDREGAIACFAGAGPVALELFDASAHHITSIEVSFTGADEALARSVIQARVYDGPIGSSGSIEVLCEDAVVRTQRGWRISERRISAPEPESRRLRQAA